jgi:membrane associated rhomboid family serine protease
MNPLQRPFRYRYDGATFWLIGINVLVFFLAQFLGRRNLAPYFAMIPAAVMQGRVWTFVSYMFFHDGFSHIFFNMFALFLFGTQV